jgi:transcriptional regulator with XRE-family HTH domain
MGRKPKSKSALRQFVPNHIRKFRKDSGLGQKHLAFLMGLKSVATLSRYESGVITPNLENLSALEQALGISYQRLYRDFVTHIATEVRMRREKLARLTNR